jgi:hypothetical protein
LRRLQGARQSHVFICCEIASVVSLPRNDIMTRLLKEDGRQGKMKIALIYVCIYISQSFLYYLQGKFNLSKTAQCRR